MVERVAVHWFLEAARGCRCFGGIAVRRYPSACPQQKAGLLPKDSSKSSTSDNLAPCTRVRMRTQECGGVIWCGVGRARPQCDANMRLSVRGCLEVDSAGSHPGILLRDCEATVPEAPRSRGEEGASTKTQKMSRENRRSNDGRPRRSECAKTTHQSIVSALSGAATPPTHQAAAKWRPDTPLHSDAVSTRGDKSARTVPESPCSVAVISTAA